ncbi:hypothetical protein VTJ83DRAFT_5204 [Remersonia thermophila]|uniref:Uncharacterized protein n=1 Tax=Remersonia thermophila TaxID=72144 RepID=A0ABR4DCB5_9PEZI
MPQPVCHYESSPSPVRDRLLVELLPQLTLESAAHAGGSGHAASLDTNAAFDQTTVPFFTLHDGLLGGHSALWTVPSVDPALSTHPHGNIITLYSLSFVPATIGGHFGVDAAPGNQDDYLKPTMNHALRAMPAMEPWRVPETAADKDMILAARDDSLQSLHAMLEQPGAYMRDEALEAVINLALGDLCYGELQDLRIHLRGAREMVKSRGGLAALDGDDILNKMLLLRADLATAIATETRPSYLDEEVAELASLLAIRSAYPTTAATTTAFAALPSFVDDTTCDALRDVNFLITKALDVARSPSPSDIRKVQASAGWLLRRVSAPPRPQPAAPSPSPRLLPIPPSPRPIRPRSPSAVALAPTLTLTTPTGAAAASAAATPRGSSLSPSPRVAPARIPTPTATVLTTPTLAPLPSPVGGMARTPGASQPGGPSAGESALGRAARLTSVIFCRAIESRQSLSRAAAAANAADHSDSDHSAKLAGAICELGAHMDGLLATTTAIPGSASGSSSSLPLARTLLGILTAVLAVPMTPPTTTAGPGPSRYQIPGQGHQHDSRLATARAIVVSALARLAVTDWEGVVDELGRVVKLQRWVSGEGNVEEGSGGGGGSSSDARIGRAGGEGGDGGRRVSVIGCSGS